MGTFNTQYLNYVNEIANDVKSLTEYADELLSLEDFKDPQMWYKGLAVCMLARQSGVEKENELALKLYHKLNEDSNCVKSGMQLSDEDYVLWFEDVKALNNLFLSKGIARAYAYQYDLYVTARYGYKNEEECRQLIRKGYELGDDLCQCFVGHSMYYGNHGFEINKEEGLQLLEQVKNTTDLHTASLFLLNIEFRACESAEEGWAVIEKFNDLLHRQKRGLYVLADYYLREDNNEKAAETLLDGIKNGSGYCAYLMGMMCSNGRFDSLGYTREQGREYLLEAFNDGVVYGGFLLGYTYLYPNDGSEPQFDIAIEYLEKACKYNSPEALLELAMLYLYHKDYLDIAKGVEFLDRAIAENYDRAMAEKGFLLLDFEGVERNVEEGKLILERAMELGNDYAPYRLGLGYQNGEFEAEPDYEKALYLFELAASRNNLSAIEYAGRYHRYGYVGEINAVKAVEYYQRAIEQFNSDYARVELAMMYFNGEGVEQDIAQTEQLYLAALENGYSYAAMRLGLLYEDGYIGEADVEKAKKYFELAAEAQVSEAIYHLGRFYRYGIAGEKDEVKAFDLFKQSLELGFIDANVDLGLAYEEGTCGQESNPELAYQYMLAAAEAGIGYAQYKIGCYYSFGYYVDTDVVEGRKWLEKGVENGSPLAMLTLGDYFLYGYEEGTEYDSAYEYYKLAEERDYISEGIGICYQFGIGVDKDENKAFNYYKIAAERGYDGAIYRLGQAYYFGIGTEKDKVEAFHYLKQVADRGNLDAASYVGVMLVKGDGTEPDPEYGVSYLIQAADQGYDYAQYELANCYLKGEGVVQSDDLAMEWYQKAADNGNEDAQKIVGGPRKRRR